jgi:glycosyltransferase involved in cell wall biosynthesis
MPSIKVMHILSDLEPGGAQYCVLDMARFLDRDRFQVHVCCLRGGGALVGKLVENRIAFHQCHFGTRLSPFGLWQLKHLIEDLGIHIVHTHLRRANHAGRIAAIWAGTPVICAHHHDTLLERKWRQRKLTGWLAKRTDRIFCVSGEVRSTRLAAGDEPEDKLRVFHNFIEPSDYFDETPKAVMKADLGLPADLPVVGIVGRLHPFKNHGLFLKAARLLLDEDPSIHFAIIGDGELRRELEATAMDMGLTGHVTFTGNRNDMPRVYRALDATVLCSTREGFGKVILESQAAGVPVVALDVGGVAEVLARGGGYLINEATPEAFAAAIDHAIQPENLQNIRLQARENVQHFSATRLITELEDIYSEMCEKKRAFQHVY